MAMTMTQKILSAHCSSKRFQTGSVFDVNVDLVKADEKAAAGAMTALEKMAARKAFNKKKIVITPAVYKENELGRRKPNREWVDILVERFGIENFYPDDESTMGMMYLPEKGFVTAGDAVIGSCEEISGLGGLGIFAVQMGYLDIAAGIARGAAWLKIPEAVKVVLSGKPGEGVTGGKIAEYVSEKIGLGGAVYKSVEFSGEGVSALSIEDRMAVTAGLGKTGAKNGIFAIDDTCLEYLKAKCDREPVVYAPDADAEYSAVYEIDLSEI